MTLDPAPAPAADLESPWRRRSSFEPSHSLAHGGDDADLPVSEV